MKTPNTFKMTDFGYDKIAERIAVIDFLGSLIDSEGFHVRVINSETGDTYLYQKVVFTPEGKITYDYNNSTTDPIFIISREDEYRSLLSHIRLTLTDFCSNKNNKEMIDLLLALQGLDV